MTSPVGRVASCVVAGLLIVASSAATGGGNALTERTRSHEWIEPTVRVDGLEPVLALFETTDSVEEEQERLEQWLRSAQALDHERMDIGPSLGALSWGELQDILRYSQQEGLHPSTIIAENGYQARRQEVSDILSERFPDSYAGHSVNSRNEPVFSFTGEVSAEGAEIVSTLPEGAWLDKTSTFSMLAAEDLLADYVYYLGEPARKTAISWDHEAQVVIILAVDEATLAASEQSAREFLDPKGVAWTASIEERLALETDDAKSRGGGHLDNGNCTTGFVMRRASDAAKRNTTAGQCYAVNETPSYRNHPTDGTGATAVTVSWLRYTYSEGDVALTTAGDYAALPSFYWLRNNKRYAYSQATSRPAVGATMCHYGATTNNSCAQVSAALACHIGICGLIGLEDATRAGGDSGGPWFVGNRAWGIHHGPHTTSDTAAFTPIWRYNDYDYYVWTNLP